MSNSPKDQYKAFCEWCYENPSFDLDPRLHQHSGPIEHGGYISHAKTATAFAAWKAALEQQPAYAVPAEGWKLVPVAWQVRNGVVTHGFYRSEAEAREVAFDMQKAHDLSGSLAAFNVRPVYATQTAAGQRGRVDGAAERTEGHHRALRFGRGPQITPSV